MGAKPYDTIGLQQVLTSAIPHNSPSFSQPMHSTKSDSRISPRERSLCKERKAQYRLYLHRLERDLQAFLRFSQLQNGPVMMPASASTAGPSLPTLLNLPPSMRILSWNCRGAGRHKFLIAVRDLIHRSNPEIFIVMDTRMHEERANPLIQRLPFIDSIILSSIGFAGGIWVMWNDAATTIRQMRLGARTIHNEVEHHTGEDPFLLTTLYNHPQPGLQPRYGLNLIHSLIVLHVLNGVVIGDFVCMLHPMKKLEDSFIHLKFLNS
ncbi:UNVERIFIED_CONTAM: hypothetical protein Slati_4452000 [Sesamum latifolium]|uniref:Endonuclease/exonuclease/phosphatase domain-containing protein n=1 Tax=Sesamum latifolium TaxID=2727402 RepID=A0AAW2SR18_9LAMI